MWFTKMDILMSFISAIGLILCGVVWLLMKLFKKEEKEMINNLKPCPFCGGKVRFRRTAFWAGVTCKECGLQASWFSKGGMNIAFGETEKKQKLIIQKAWNRRSER